MLGDPDDQRALLGKIEDEVLDEALEELAGADALRDTDLDMTVSRLEIEVLVNSMTLLQNKAHDEGDIATVAVAYSLRERLLEQDEEFEQYYRETVESTPQSLGELFGQGGIGFMGP